MIFLLQVNSGIFSFPDKNDVQKNTRSFILENNRVSD